MVDGRAQVFSQVRILVVKKILNSASIFQNTVIVELDRQTDGRTDGQTDGRPDGVGHGAGGGAAVGPGEQVADVDSGAEDAAGAAQHHDTTVVKLGVVERVAQLLQHLVAASGTSQPAAQTQNQRVRYRRYSSPANLAKKKNIEK